MEAGDQPFGFGAFRLIRESNDAGQRAAGGPLEVTEGRVSRAVEEMGAGRPLRVDEGHDATMLSDRPGFEALPDDEVPYRS